MEQDWANNLPSEVIYQISSSLYLAEDLPSFRLVCKRWNANTCDDLTAAVPWCIDGDLLNCVSVVSSLKTYTCQNIPVDGCFCLPQSNYLIFLNRQSHVVTLVNPVTGEFSNPPPLPEKASWCDPISANEDRIVLCWGRLDTNERTIGIWKYESGSWLVVRGKYKYSRHTSKGKKIYLQCEETREIDVLDEPTGTIIDTLTYPDDCTVIGRDSNYLIEAAGEILLVASQFEKPAIPAHRRSCFRLYKLSNQTWVRLYQIPDLIIFIDNNHGFGLRGPLPGYETNSIYFFRYAAGRFYLCRYSLENDQHIILPRSFTVAGWFRPHLSRKVKLFIFYG